MPGVRAATVRTMERIERFQIPAPSRGGPFLSFIDVDESISSQPVGTICVVHHVVIGSDFWDSWIVSSLRLIVVGRTESEGTLSIVVVGYDHNIDD